MASIEEILSRIDLVIKENKKIEWAYIILTVILFVTGISCFVTALFTGYFARSTPSAITTGLLYWPLREIRNIRQKNIALATAPILITQLSKAKAAKEIQKLLHTLYGEDR